jgi:hypothetical protein
LPALFLYNKDKERIERGVGEMKQGTIALKEWAVAVKALEEAKQIFILRKGGIREETRDFQIESNDFYLYPTYEHQKKELLKEPYVSSLADTLKKWNPDSQNVTLTSYAELVEDLEISELDKLNRLAPFHIWTDSFIDERLKWKRKSPLHLMLLRVYKLAVPRVIEVESSYLGCKSWIELQGDWSNQDMTPVVNDDEFASKIAEIKKILA